MGLEKLENVLVARLRSRRREVVRLDVMRDLGDLGDVLVFVADGLWL